MIQNSAFNNKIMNFTKKIKKKVYDISVEKKN